MLFFLSQDLGSGKNNLVEFGRKIAKLFLTEPLGCIKKLDLSYLNKKMMSI